MKIALPEICEHCGKSPTGKGLTIIDAPESAPSAGERVRAMSEMLRFGLGERHEVISGETVRERLRAQRKLIREVLPIDQAETLLLQLRDIWG